MTHSTDAERAEFEVVASDNGKWRKAIERAPNGDYILMATESGWRWWQAARRAPAAPVPQGWKLVPDEFIQKFGDLAHNYSLKAEAPAHYWNDGERSAFSDGYARCGRELEKLMAMIAAAPQPPEEGCSVSTAETLAAPVQMPEPDSYKHILDTTEGIAGNQPEVKRTDESENPFGIAGVDYDKLFPYSTEKLYTEQQVRQLIAAHGITQEKQG